MSISFFDDVGGLFSHFSQLSSLRLLGQSSEVECNPKLSISFFDDLGAFFHILVNFCPSDHSTNHQKLNFIQKPTLNFLKIYFQSLWGGGNISNFFEFFNFFKLFHTEVAQNDPQWQILPKKWLRLAQNGQFRSFCMFFHLFPQNEAQIDSEWPISPGSQLFPSFATKASNFCRNLKKFCSWGGGYIKLWSCQIYHKIFLPDFQLFNSREVH